LLKASRLFSGGLSVRKVTGAAMIVLVRLFDTETLKEREAGRGREGEMPCNYTRFAGFNEASR
jgi:hypothetical protein